MPTCDLSLLVAPDDSADVPIRLVIAVEELVSFAVLPEPLLLCGLAVDGTAVLVVDSVLEQTLFVEAVLFGSEVAAVVVSLPVKTTEPFEKTPVLEAVSCA